MSSIAAQILTALSTTLADVPGVDVFVDDPARLIARPDGVVLMLEWEEAAGGVDNETRTCDVVSYLPILVTLYCPRSPEDPPGWDLLDPYYVELHGRIMADRTLGGLAMDTKSISRQPESGVKGCALQCRYSVQYRTRQEDVELQ